MADMFYSLQEACSKLGKTEEEVKALVASGQLEEIRDGEDLKFAAADIDVLAGNNDSVGDLDDALGGLGLDDTSGQSGFGLGLADTGTGLGLTDTSEGTGYGGARRWYRRRNWRRTGRLGGRRPRSHPNRRCDWR